MELTKNQKDLMAHTISGHDRNWFGTDKSCKDSKEFELLVSADFATAETPPSWMGDEVIYRLTKKGKDALSAG